MFLKFIRTKTLQLVAVTKEAARANSKNIVLDSADNILKVVDENGNTKAIEPNSGFNGAKIVKRYDFDFDGASGNGGIGNINLETFPAGHAVITAQFIKTGSGLAYEGETVPTLKLALATDGDVTATVNASTGVNTAGIVNPNITYRKASAAQALRLVVAAAAVTGTCAVEVVYQNVNHIAANNPVETEE